MSRSIAAKFTAFVLAALTMVASAAFLLGIGVLSYQGLYDSSLDELAYRQMEGLSYTIAIECAERYAAEHQGGCSQHLVQSIFGGYPGDDDLEWSAQVLLQGELLEQIGARPDAARQYTHSFVVTYPAVVQQEQHAVRTSAVTIWEGGKQVDYTLYYYNSPEYTVEVFLQPRQEQGNGWELLKLMYSNRYQLIVYGAVSLLAFAACVVYLCCVAGKKQGRDAVRPGGLNRLPLDLYAVAVGGLALTGCLLGQRLVEWTFSEDVNYGGIILGGILAVLLSLLVLAFLFALAAQLKARHFYWWRNSLIGRIGIGLYKCLRWTGRGILRLFTLLPVIWQWVLTALVMALALFIAFYLAVGQYSYWRVDGTLMAGFLLVLVLCVGIVCYGGYCFGTLLSGVKRMNRGNLDHKIPTKYLIGAFRDFAIALNGLSGSAMAAAQNQLKSERMKTELITNVSHDIKTPLTSIINYVDLLQKPHTPEEEAQYLEVLSRQSLRLKKLIDDLMEMSKASTGNLTVEITEIDAAEAVNQALGEFSGKLERAQLIPVFTPPEGTLLMRADGRLVWRVLSNLLGNAVKYALPGTRVYIDTARVGGQVMISLKNISKERLDVDAAELMERFVRGDASRNTEGSGLGLNIAKSLMEVQHGRLNLLVDGDLFKVTLVFLAE